MDEKKLCEAVENISLIKGVIERTSKSFAGFSQLFIYWGLLFILNSIFTLIMILNKERVVFELSIKYPLLNYIFPIGIFTVLAFLIYKRVSKKMPLVGLEKHLMKVWLLILVLNVIPTKISINASSAVDVGTVSVHTNNFSTLFFSLSIALIVTSLFTGYKQLKNVGFAYIAISITHAYFNLAIFKGTLIELLSLLVIPFTFLYTGFFLKFKQARGNTIGY